MDQLSENLFQKYPHNYFGGKDDCNLLVWGDKGQTKHTPKIITFLIGCEYSPYSADEQAIEEWLDNKLAKDLNCKRLVEKGNEMSHRSSLPFLIIIYPSMRTKFDGRWEESREVYDEEKVCFYYKTTTHNQLKAINGSLLRQLLYSYLGNDYNDTGTTKDKNKRIADYFHMWSRDCLSRNIAKVDIDGFLIDNNNNNQVLVEIKRSHQTPYIPEWYPIYDKADYLLQYSFAKKLGAKFWLLHHELGTDKEMKYVSYFDITDVCDNNETKLSQTFLRFSYRVHELPFSGDNSLYNIIDKFISGTPQKPVTLVCPICGGKISDGDYGLYCKNKSNCRMTLGKAFGDKLTETEIKDLLSGKQIEHLNTTNNKKCTVYPFITPYTWGGRSGFSWVCK